MTDETKPHTCPRCAGQKVRPGVYTGVCLTCIDRRWEEARADLFTGTALLVVARNAEAGASEDNPAPFPEPG